MPLKVINILAMDSFTTISTSTDVFDISDINESESDHISDYDLVDSDHSCRSTNANGGCVIA